MGILTKGQYTLGNKTKTEIANLIAPTNLTGTASITSGSSTINGTGTLFLSQVVAGDILRFPSDGFSVVVLTVNSNTSITTVAPAPTTGVLGTIQLMNPRRLKAGDSVFNTTDKFPMYYTGDNTGIVGKSWKRGDFVNGQVTCLANNAEVTTITEGNVLQTNTSAGCIESYIAGTIDPAVATAYQTAFGGSCVASAVTGIHNTSISGTVTKGNYVRPSTSTNTSSVVDNGVAPANNDSCGVTCTNNGTPAVGQVELLLNYTQRL